MTMYYMDATELNGVIYLFGKILLMNDNTLAAAGATTPAVSANSNNKSDKKFVSCCVAIHGMERNLFILPKVVSNDVGGVPIRANFVDVYKEIQNILVPHIIPKQAGGGDLFRCKKVTREYAFELSDIPREETEYLKVVYSAKYGVPYTNQCNGVNLQCIQHIFGVSSTVLDLFLMKRKLMGPCWIKIKSPKLHSDPVSWCKIECYVDNPMLICKLDEQLPPPPLVSMCLSMKTAVNPSTHVHEIVALSGIVHTNMKADEDTAMNVNEMKRFTMICALGTTCGADFPHTFHRH